MSGNPWIIHHLGHDIMYIAEVIDVVEEMRLYQTLLRLQIN